MYYKSELSKQTHTFHLIILSSIFLNTFSHHRLIPHIKGNVGFVFTKEDLNEVRELIRSNKVAAPAKAGAIAPIDVKIPPGNTGLGPEKTSFFQALAIPTKITRGTIEILVGISTNLFFVGASFALAPLLTFRPFVNFPYEA